MYIIFKKKTEDTGMILQLARNVVTRSIECESEAHGHRVDAMVS